MIARFFRGVSYFGRGWRAAFGEGALLPWVLLPALLTALLAGGGTWLSWRWLAALAHRHTMGHGLVWDVFVWSLAVLLAMAVAYVLYIASCVLLTAPFAGVLSEGAERLATGQKVPAVGLGQLLTQAARGLGHSLLLVLLYLVIALPLFLLHWIAPPSSPLLALAGLAQAALFFAFDAFSEPLHRRGYGFVDKWRFLQAHLPESLGFGTAVALLVMVPLFSIIVTPVALVGGTLLFIELEREGGGAALP